MRACNTSELVKARGIDYTQVLHDSYAARGKQVCTHVCMQACTHTHVHRHKYTHTRREHPPPICSSSIPSPLLCISSQTCSEWEMTPSMSRRRNGGAVIATAVCSTSSRQVSKELHREQNNELQSSKHAVAIGIINVII